MLLDYLLLRFQLSLTTTFSSRFGSSPTTFTVAPADGLTIKADDPKYRIDYVMATGPIAERITESRPLFEGAFRLNVADPKAFALSDHLPQLAVFGGEQA